jgi:hypothetical protein
MRLADEVSSSLTGPSSVFRRHDLAQFRRHDLAQRAINFYADADFRVFQQPQPEADMSGATEKSPLSGE